MLYSDKINLRASKRLDELYLEDKRGNDAWCQDHNWLKHLEEFLLKCDETQLKQIIALSIAPASYAFDALFTLFHNKGIMFPFENAEELAVATSTDPLFSWANMNEAYH